MATQWSIAGYFPANYVHCKWKAKVKVQHQTSSPYVTLTTKDPPYLWLAWLYRHGGDVTEDQETTEDLYPEASHEVPGTSTCQCMKRCHAPNKQLIIFIFVVALLVFSWISLALKQVPYSQVHLPWQQLSGSWGWKLDLWSHACLTPR